MKVFTSSEIASSVPLVNTSCWGSTLKNSAIFSFACEYSGYILIAFASITFDIASITFGEHPTVFSLKSKRILSALPCEGGEYGRIFLTAAFGCNRTTGCADCPNVSLLSVIRISIDRA